MNRRPTVLGSVARTALARLPVCAALVALLLAPSLAVAGDPPKPDPIVGVWSVDVDATTKGVSEAVALDLDALPPADRAEEMLRRETFLQALRFEADGDGTFVLGVGPRTARNERATRGTWAAKGHGRYALTVRARFGVLTPTGEGGPFEAVFEEVPGSMPDAYRLSYRDRDGTRLVFRRPTDAHPPAPVPAPAAPTAPSTPAAPAPAPAPVPGAHPDAYVAAWELDRERMIDVALALARKQLEALEPEKRKVAEALLDRGAARDQMRLQLDAMQVEVTLRSDGTLEAILGLPGKDAEKAAGTWQEADGKVVLVIDTKDGAPASEADRKPVSGRLDGGILWLEMAGGAPAIPLRKLSR